MNKLYKYSQYNIEIEKKDNGDTYLFNTYTSNGRWIPKSDLDDIKDKTSIDLGDIPLYLAKEQFIVPSNLDEYGRLQNEIYDAAHNSKTLQFIIATTKACNYRCYYCFEAQHLSNEKIQPDTMDGIVRFIIQKCEENPNVDNVLLQWFGGEPLLYQEPIRYITKKLQEKYTEEHNINIRGHITTNGRLLTPDVADDMISNYSIKSVQITLDGLSKEYARIKGCSENDFDTVINNIKYAQDKLIVYIRLNLGDNLQSLKDLIAYMTSEKLKVYIQISHIFDTSQSPEIYQEAYRLFTEDNKELMEYIIKNGYSYLIGGEQKIPRRRLVCKANTTWQYAIDIYGNLYRCVDMIMRPSYSIGNIKDGITNTVMEQTFTENPLYEKCKSCAFLPQCFGKCTMERIIENKGIDCNTIENFTIANIKRTIQR